MEEGEGRGRGRGRGGGRAKDGMRLYLIFVCAIKRTASMTESPWLLLVKVSKVKKLYTLHVFLNFERGLSFPGLIFRGLRSL